MTALWGRGALRQRKTKIDRRLIQNPAYGPVVFYNKSAPHAVKILCAGLFRVLSLKSNTITGLAPSIELHPAALR